MKINFSKIVCSVGLATLLSSNMFGASLKGIELEEDLSSACDKFKSIYKDNKKVQITLDYNKHRCGWDNILMGYIGIEADNENKVTSINIPIEKFGFSILDGAKTIADKYVQSEGAAVRTMDRFTSGKYEYYQGYSIRGQIQVTIDNMFIKLETSSAGEPVNFK